MCMLVKRQAFATCNMTGTGCNSRASAMRTLHDRCITPPYYMNLVHNRGYQGWRTMCTSSASLAARNRRDRCWFIFALGATPALQMQHVRHVLTANWQAAMPDHFGAPSGKMCPMTTSSIVPCLHELAITIPTRQHVQAEQRKAQA